MQEDIERRTVALSIKTTKLTGRVLAKSSTAFLRKIQKERRKAQTPQGRQSVKKLMDPRVSTNNLDLSGDTKLFDSVVRTYNEDYAFHKTSPDKYLLFFKAGQADAITAAFSNYTKLVMGRGKNRRPSILRQLKHFREKARSQPHERQRKREAAHEDR
jgi:hypothetical protein